LLHFVQYYCLYWLTCHPKRCEMRGFMSKN
jgi:hypothetical protein